MIPQASFRILSVVAFLGLLVLTGCLKPVQDIYPPDENLREVPLYVISHGWHVGIAMHSNYFKNRLPGHPRLPDGEIYMIGWGDNRYYPDREAGVWLALRAALLPTGSVLHVVGISRPVDRYFAASTIVKIHITEEGANRIASHIAGQFSLEEDQIRFVAEGLYSESAFFEANGFYYFPKTSNKWTAQAVRKTGFPITPFYAVTSGNVVRQVKKDGVVIRE